MQRPIIVKHRKSHQNIAHIGKIKARKRLSFGTLIGDTHREMAAAIPSMADSFRLAGTLGGARAFMSMGGDTLPPDAQRRLQELLDSILEYAERVSIGAHALLHLPDELQTDQLLHEWLSYLSLAVDEFQSLLADLNMIKLPGPDKLERLQGVADELEDVQEALALGLSAEFKQQLADAKKAASASD